MKKNKKRADGRVKASIYVGNGKYKYVYADNNRELERKVLDVKAKMGKGIDVSADRDTFKEWADRWLEIKRSEVSLKRYQAYKGKRKRLSELDDYSISKIRAADIQDIILELAEEGYAKQTIQQYKSTCRQIFKLAVDNRVIDFNPADSVKVPRAENDESDSNSRRALTPTEQSWITGTEHRAKPAAMIMMYAGLRRGELIPLTWADIDLTAKTISVNKAVEAVNGRTRVKKHAKSDAGLRTIYIPQVLADYLSTLPRDNDLVCPDAHGHMMTETAWKRLWDSYLSTLNFEHGNFSDVYAVDKKTGKRVKFEKPKSRHAPVKIPFVIPRITAHWLRHTFITLMYLAGVDVLTAKEQAGHADITTTLQIYSHLDSIYKVKQISKLDDYLSNAGQMRVSTN